MSDLPTPITREEQFLNGIAQGDTNDLPSPVTREEKYLDYIARNGGGGGGGTTNYNALDNKPQIAGTTLQGDKSLADLGIASASAVETALGNKVDKVAGKGLSTNDYDNTEKDKVAANTGAIEATQDMISDAYDSTHTYNVGDYCIHENVLYKCNTASTTGTWDSSKWHTTNISEEINTNFNKIAVKESTTDITPVNAFEAGGVGMVTDIFNKEGQNVGHLVYRPKGYASGYALELYYADWSGRAWDVPAILNREDSFNSADANNVYTIPLNDRSSYILSVNVMSPSNVYASNATNADTNYGKSVRLYKYDGTPYTGAATLKTISISLPVS